MNLQKKLEKNYKKMDIQNEKMITQKRDIDKDIVIDEQFTDIIREQMSDFEFWQWVKSWLDQDEGCEMAEEWFDDNKKKFIKEWKNGYWKQEFFPLTSVSREDLENIGYDTSKVGNDTMEELASKMGESIMNEFWIDLPIIADDLGIPEKKKQSNKK